MSSEDIKEYNIYYLEMHKQVSKAEEIDSCYSLKKLEKPISTEQYIKLYKGVGDAYQWTDRLQLSSNELETLINKTNTHIYLLQAHGVDVGYTELVLENQHVELQYFGLFTAHIGKGYGTQLLKKTIVKAWSFTPQWVQLNTCDLDHPKALALYKQVGFEEVSRRRVKAS